VPSTDEVKGLGTADCSSARSSRAWCWSLPGCCVSEPWWSTCLSRWSRGSLRALRSAYFSQPSEGSARAAHGPGAGGVLRTPRYLQSAPRRDRCFLRSRIAWMRSSISSPRPRACSSWNIARPLRGSPRLRIAAQTAWAPCWWLPAPDVGGPAPQRRVREARHHHSNV